MRAVISIALALLVVGCRFSQHPDERAAPVAVPADFDVQGHRGARGLRPENTLPAFEVALDHRVDTLELDLHLSADDVLVVWHDPVIEPSKCRLDPDATPPLPPAPQHSTDPSTRRVRALTFAQLRKYVCDKNPQPQRFSHQTAEPTALAGDDYRIPSLEIVFDFVDRYARSDKPTASSARSVRFNVETKRVADDPTTIDDGFDGEHAGPFELNLVELVRSRGLLDRVTVQSFDHRSLWAVAAIEPRLRLAALTEGAPALAVAELATHGASVWSPAHDTLDPASVEAAHAAGLAVIPWTVNDPATIKALIDLGVDGIITDRPDLLDRR